MRFLVSSKTEAPSKGALATVHMHGKVWPARVETEGSLGWGGVQSERWAGCSLSTGGQR